MSGNRKLVLALCLVGAALALWGGAKPRGAEAVVVNVRQSTDTLSIVWTGDTFVGDAVQSRVQTLGHDWPFEGVRQLLNGDVVVVNAEGPLTNLDRPFVPTKDYSYRADPVSAWALAGAGVTVVGLANNHALDQGPAGLQDTMRYARQAGLTSFGAGRNDSEAERPLIVRGSGVTVGIVALAKGYGSRVTAGRARAGTIPFSETSIARGYALARAAGADVVVAFVHWGANYRPVLDDQRRVARLFASAGYDLVIGHGPHVVHPVEMVGSMPVFFSLGNYVFGTPGRFTADLPGHGLVLRTEFGPKGLVGASVTCIDVDNDDVRFQPHVSTPEDAAKVFSEIHVPLIVEGASAFLMFPHGT